MSSRAACLGQVATASPRFQNRTWGTARANGTYRSERERYLRTIVELVAVVPYTEQTAYEHARLWAELERAGKRIGYYDLIVGATALERGSAVATFNTKHFGQIRGLKVIEPS